MGALLQTEVLWGEVRRHWISILFVLITLITILLFTALRWYLKRRWKLLVKQRLDDEHELDLLPPVSAKDREALKLIKQLRNQVWELPEIELRLSVEALSLYAVRIVRSIAAIYHEQSAVPEYEASLIESLQLVRRVTSRLIRLASLSPFRFLGEQKLSDYQRYYLVYKKINENPLLQMLKQHRRLYRVARWAMDLKNIGNPFYWVGKELSREGYFFVLRWFYLAFVSQVGREAMQLYSGRHFQKEEDRDAVLICYRLFALTKQWSGPLPEDWPALIDFVSNQSSLESESRVDILSRCARDHLPKDLESQVVQTESGKKWYRQGLKTLLAQAPQLTLRSEIIQREMEKLDEKEDSSELPTRSKLWRLKRTEKREES